MYEVLHTRDRRFVALVVLVAMLGCPATSWACDMPSTEQHIAAYLLLQPGDIKLHTISQQRGHKALMQIILGRHVTRLHGPDMCANNISCSAAPVWFWVCRSGERRAKLLILQSAAEVTKARGCHIFKKW